MGRARQRTIRTIRRRTKPTLPPMKPDDLCRPAACRQQTRDGFPVRMGPRRDARAGRHLRRLRPRLGERVEHAVPRVQALGPRGRHQHAADRPLAGGHRGEGRAAPRSPGHLIDIMATCVDLAGEVTPSDGCAPLGRARACVPAFAGKPLDRDALYWEHEGNRAVRVGDWKLVAKHNEPWELYDMRPTAPSCTTSRPGARARAR